MKIEKMNEHQIRCTLTREDLAMRHIKLSELAYGSENAKSLFRDMMQQAAMDFGFEAEDIPLMIEAIPLSPEKIVLIITKVDSPDELDTRFSNFTPFDDDEEDADDGDTESISLEPGDAASELLNLFSQLKKEKSKSSAEADPAEQPAQPPDLTRLFAFRELDEVIRAARSLHGFYHGTNSLYKDPKSDLYYLTLYQDDHTVSEFTRVNNVISAYLQPRKYTAGAQAYFEEHLQVLIEGNALQSLAEI